MTNDNNIHTNLLYTKEHEWISIDDNSNIATVGITHFAQEQLGDIVFVELPEINEGISQDDSFGVVESIKSVSDLYAPISGIITEVNTTLEESPEKINEDPYSNWMIKLKITNLDETKKLLSSDMYKEYCV